MVLKISSKLRTTEKWSEKKTHNNDEKSNEKFFGWFVIVHSFTHTIENSNKTDDEVKSTEHLDLKRAMKIAIEKLDCFCKFLLQDDKNVNQFKCKTAKSRRKNKKHKKQKKNKQNREKLSTNLKHIYCSEDDCLLMRCRSVFDNKLASHVHQIYVLCIHIFRSGCLLFISFIFCFSFVWSECVCERVFFCSLNRWNEQKWCHAKK